MYAGFVMFGYMQIYLDINGSTIMTVLPGGGTCAWAPAPVPLLCSWYKALYVTNQTIIHLMGPHSDIYVLLRPCNILFTPE